MKEYELNVDPRILELLGPNLYTNIYYVLAELIANAYDADASNVYIISHPTEIRVEDDGLGMSYQNGDIKRYLNVAGVSRNDESDALTKIQKRKKMGRKGVGKLAALSVSESVDIITISNYEKSGFVLSRKPENGNKLKSIDDENITFDFITNHGTAIVMKNPQYRLHKTLKAVKRNLLNIFPLVNNEFKIHIVRGIESETIDNFDRSIMSELCALISIGEEFSNLKESVPVKFPDKNDVLIEVRETFSTPVEMVNNFGVKKEYDLVIKGWIGAYITTRGRKAEMTDFPDNFISLFANNKMGEFNILPIVGQNKLNEVYIVGQLHVDLFELSELPDMALSNRQGYRTDDPRYQVVRDYVKDHLLPEILNKRKLYTDLGKDKKKNNDLEFLRSEEVKFKKIINDFRDKTSSGAADLISKLGTQSTKENIEQVIKETISINSPDLGVKSIIDSQKKKILISQTFNDKQLSDIIYSQLVYNNVPPDDILYTNCDDEICRVPEGVGVYEYLRDFFIESYSTQKIYVLFVTSENTKTSWGALTEVGASWITQIDHKIFNIYPFRPEHPLNDELQWHNTNRDSTDDKELYMSKLNADIFCQKIENVCDKLGYSKRSRNENFNYLQKMIQIRS